MGGSRKSIFEKFEDDTVLEMVANRPGRPLRGIWTGCRNGPTPTFAVQQRKVQSPAAQEHRQGPTGRKEGEKGEKGLRFLVDIKCAMSLQTTFVAKKFNSMRAALGKTASSRSREVILLLC